MRTFLLAPPLLFATLSSVGCKWSEFDDLAAETWVKSTEKPNVGSTDYATAIIGISSGTSGGQLAVVSNDVPSYSTLDYAADGAPALGANPQKLGVHFIAALSETPIFVTDGMGKVALVERAIDAGNIAVVFATSTTVTDSPFVAMDTPDAAAFAGGNLVVAAGNTLHTLTGMGAPTPCMANDVMGMPFAAAALAADATTLWAWTENGALVGYPIAALTPCTGGVLPAPGNSFMTTGFMPGTGARIHISGNFAILAGHAATSRAGQVVVVDLTTMTQVGTTLPVEDLRSSTVATLETGTYLALGVPDRVVDGVVSGAVDLHLFATDTGMLDATPALTLHDAQPESGELFGRTVTTMQFNGTENVLVVGANSEVFTYFRTSLYNAF